MKPRVWGGEMGRKEWMGGGEEDEKEVKMRRWVDIEVGEWVDKGSMLMWLPTGDPRTHRQGFLMSSDSTLQVHFSLCTPYALLVHPLCIALK